MARTAHRFRRQPGRARPEAGASFGLGHAPARAAHRGGGPAAGRPRAPQSLSASPSASPSVSWSAAAKSIARSRTRCEPLGEPLREVSGRQDRNRAPLAAVDLPSPPGSSGPMGPTTGSALRMPGAVTTSAAPRKDIATIIPVLDDTDAPTSQFSHRAQTPAQGRLKR